MASVTFKSFCRLPESSSQPGSHCEPGLPPVFPRTENGVPALHGKTLAPRIWMLPSPSLPLLTLPQDLPLLLLPPARPPRLRHYHRLIPFIHAFDCPVRFPPLSQSMCATSIQLCPTLCDPVNCSPPGFSVHEIDQARILEWVAMPSSKGSS